MIEREGGGEGDIENPIEFAMESTSEEAQSMAMVEEKLVQVRDQKKRMKSSSKKKLKKKKKSNKKNERDCCLLVSYDELPEYMKENEYIRNYYRSEWPLSSAFLSLFSWHNETINIWTHLVGFFVFLGFTMVHLGHVPQVADLLGHLSCSISASTVGNASCNQANFFNLASPIIKLSHPPNSSSALLDPRPAATAARWPFFVFLAGSMFCLLTSSLCHLLCCHSRRLSLLLTRLDYTGIAVMIATSFFPPIYYIFQCDPLYQITYLAAISIFGVLTVLTLFSPELSKRRFRSYRAKLFVAMALFGVVPAVHATIVNWAEPRRNMTLAYEGAMAASYLTGTLFYVSRAPERWRPGMFDLAGHSHQIFHLLVICGALAHYGAGLIFLEFRDAIACDKS